MSLLGGSMRRLSGTPSAVPRAHSVSSDGLPVPFSSWESVDLAMPARLASSVSDRPVRARSRRRDSETSATTSAEVPGLPDCLDRLDCLDCLTDCHAVRSILRLCSV